MTEREETLAEEEQTAAADESDVSRTMSRTDNRFESFNDESSASFSSLMMGLIAPRAVLIQVVPILTPLALYAGFIAGTPPFVSWEGEKSKLFAPLYIRHSQALEIARHREKRESGENSSAKDRGIEWIINLKVISVFAESRGLQFAYNSFRYSYKLHINNCTLFILIQTFSVAMSIGLLQSSALFWLICSFFIYIPFMIILSLDLIILLGKAADIRDSDWVRQSPTPSLSFLHYNTPPRHSKRSVNIGQSWLIS